MHYLICSLQSANSNGIAVTPGHPTHNGLVCLNSTDVILCPKLSGTLDDRAKVLDATIYNSAKEVNEAIKSWFNDNDN